MIRIFVVLLLGGLVGCGAASKATEAGLELELSVEGDANPLVGETVWVRAVFSKPTATASAYKWSAVDPDGQPVPVDPSGSASPRASFVPVRPGSHRVVCRATLAGSGSSFTATGTIQVSASAEGRRIYTVRILPPPQSGLPPVEREETVGRSGKTGLTWIVGEGVTTRLEVRDASGPVPCLVRLARGLRDPLPRDLYLPEGGGSVRLSDSFDALFVPDGDVAPVVKGNLSAARLAPFWRVELSPGYLVEGSVRGPDGALPGAAVSLHTTDEAGLEAPSTVGRSRSDGAFRLRSRAGAALLFVVPPEGSLLPVATVRDARLQLSASASDWRFTFAAHPAATVTGQVSASDGARPAPRAAVVLELEDPTSAGSLRTSLGTFEATASYRRELVSGELGELVDPLRSGDPVRVPLGRYRITVHPAAGAPVSEGRSERLVEVRGAEALTLRLAERVLVTGVVRKSHGEPVVAHVRASSAGGQFSTLTDEAGRFSLRVDAGESYDLLVRPLEQISGVGPLLLPAVKVSGATDLQTVALPAAMRLAGKVRTSGNLALPGALLRIWCSGQECPSRAVLDETHTGPDGSFELRVPAP
ncbi:MAG: hypothetical protein IT371_13875 [Deltaproteobacteria bacterium]|nr:hypothetical protein [Deltaproteobacteria bacterium]